MAMVRGTTSLEGTLEENAVLDAAMKRCRANAASGPNGVKAAAKPAAAAAPSVATARPFASFTPAQLDQSAALIFEDLVKAHLEKNPKLKRSRAIYDVSRKSPAIYQAMLAHRARAQRAARRASACY